MSRTFSPSADLAKLRGDLDHPILDVDAHQMEVAPVFLDFLRDIGGVGMPDRWIAYVHRLRRVFDMTPAERADEREAVPVWWPVPAENTLDRATSSLPHLLYERLDEIGLDFSIVYPGTGMLTIMLPGMADNELRHATARACNLYYAEVFRGLEDRLTPTAVIPMHTPQEAIEELEFAVNELGLKAALFAGDVLRPIPAIARRYPELAEIAVYQDCFGIDSPFDYDPLWDACVRLRIAPTFHSGPIGRGSRRSISRHQYNQLGGFAEGGEAICKALFFGGVTRRFPQLRLGFLEGGAGWATILYSRLLDHWKKRNGDSIQHLDPARIDTDLFASLIDEYGHELVRHHRDAVVADSTWGDRMEQLDDWRACEATTVEDLRDLFVPHFFFGCEGDDRATATAFDTSLNPFGVRMNAMLGSDLGHFDVEDVREIVVEAHELVDDGLIDAKDFKDYAFANGVRLHGGMNPDFFVNTKIESDAAGVLAGSS